MSGIKRSAHSCQTGLTGKRDGHIITVYKIKNKGVPQSRDKALALYEKAAASGDAYAQSMLESLK